MTERDLHKRCSSGIALQIFFCSVTFPKSIVRSNIAFVLVQPPLAQIFFGASIR
jgi:hypothetical protein